MSSAAQAGNHNILQREQPSTGVQTGTYPDGRPIMTFTANAVDTPAYPLYNVLDFGAAGDGVTDDTAAIQAALTAACANGGGIVFVPAGVYLISAMLLITADNVQVQGAGWASIFMPAATFVGSYLLQVQQPGGGAFRYGIVLRDLFFNCNHVAGVGGLDLVTTYHARVEHVRVRYCLATAIMMDGSSGNTGAYNVIDNCTLTDGASATAIAISTNFSEWLTVVGGTISFYNVAGAVGIKCSNLNCRFIGVGIDNNDTGIQLEFAGRAVVQGCQFDRGQKRFIYLHGTQYCAITGNIFNTYNGTSGTGCLDVTDGNNAGNIIANNTVKGASGWTNFIDEHGTVGTPVNTYSDNETGGAALVLVNGTARNNRGYNPRGAAVTQLAAAATGVALTNTTGCDCMLLVGGGTLTQIALGGVNTGLTSGWFRVPAGQTVTLTYSAAPTTFQWFGD